MLRQALILAGGLGTRMYPFTKQIPKPLALLDHKPIIYHILMSLKFHGIEEVIIHVAYQGQLIRDYLGDGTSLGLNIKYAPSHIPVGTGGGLRIAAGILDDDFICMNSDEITNLNFRDLANFHVSHKSLATISLVEVKDVTDLGVAVVEDEHIRRFVEKPTPEEAPSHLVSQGIYALNRGIIDEIPNTPSPSLERDVWPKLASKGQLLAFRAPRTVYWKSLNNPKELENMRIEMWSGRLKWLREYQEDFESDLLG